MYLIKDIKQWFSGYSDTVRYALSVSIVAGISISISNQGCHKILIQLCKGLMGPSHFDEKTQQKVGLKRYGNKLQFVRFSKQYYSPMYYNFLFVKVLYKIQITKNEIILNSLVLLHKFQFFKVLSMVIMSQKQ